MVSNRRTSKASAGLGRSALPTVLGQDDKVRGFRKFVIVLLSIIAASLAPMIPIMRSLSITTSNQANFNPDQFGKGGVRASTVTPVSQQTTDNWRKAAGSKLTIFGSTDGPGDFDDDGIEGEASFATDPASDTISWLRRIQEKDDPDVGVILLSLTEQRSYMQHLPRTSSSAKSLCVGKTKEAVHKFDTLVERGLPHLATELWKYCALESSLDVQDDENMFMYIDPSIHLVSTVDELLTILRSKVGSVAVLGDRASAFNTIHGSLLAFRGSQHPVARVMLELILDTPVDSLALNSRLLPEKLYYLISAQMPPDTKNPSQMREPQHGQNGNPWYLLGHTCFVSSFIQTSSSYNTNGYELAIGCPKESGECCVVFQYEDTEKILFRSAYPVLPYHKENKSLLPLPYNPDAGRYRDDELPFIATVREEIFVKPDDHPPTPNVYEKLQDHGVLRERIYRTCNWCLRHRAKEMIRFDFETCTPCNHECHKYCELIESKSNKSKVETKFVSKRLHVTLPAYRKDPSRVIPRIIHQTWKENITQEKYPIISRFVGSFVNTQWEYKFYTDEESREFLKTHFPIEVLEAYDALLPGAFKADLFRYCALLIHGGIYADVDKLLESDLDLSVPSDAGFTIPTPNTMGGQYYCLHNGFMAAAPGHPFLVETIQNSVNIIRNRQVLLDIVMSYRPDPNLLTLHVSDMFFITGPCVLGTSVNKILGRHRQTEYMSGTIDWPTASTLAWANSTADITPYSLETYRELSRKFGRTVILEKVKDLGDGTRYVLQERNMIVAASHLPDTLSSVKDDEHYTKIKQAGNRQSWIYGIADLYTDDPYKALGNSTSPDDSNSLKPQLHTNIGADEDIIFALVLDTVQDSPSPNAPSQQEKGQMRSTERIPADSATKTER